MDTKAMVRVFAESIINVKKVFFGWSRDDKLRYEAASGGIVTSLLKYMIEHRIANYAIVTVQRKFTAAPCVASNFVEVFESKGSIYFKTFTGRIVRELLKLLRDGYRVVFVGLPCMIRIIKRIIPENQHGRVFFVSLMCYHINELWYLKYVLSRFSPSKNAKPLTMTSRRGGWPGGITIAYELSKGRVVHVRVPQFSFWNIVPIFELTAPNGCLFCIDHLGIGADVVVADAWHPKYLGRDRLGVSLILVRNEKGLKVLRDAARYGYIELIEGSLGDLIIAQKWNAILRPLQALARKYFMNKTSFTRLLVLIPRLLLFELLRFILLSIINSIKPFGYLYVIIRILEKTLYIVKLPTIQDKMLKIYINNPKLISQTLEGLIS